MTSKANPIIILMAEDNPDDVELTQAALQDAKVHTQLHTVDDGVKVLQFLNREGEHANAPRPNLILLDLNMPRMDGREVLRRIKENEDLRSIPVVILTTSAAEDDILDAYKHSVNCYIRKPVDFEQFVHVVRSIENFWFTVVELPKR